MKTYGTDSVGTYKGKDGYNVGLTKREHFAALALQGLVTDSRRDKDEAVRLAARYADALIDELNKGALDGTSR